MRPRIGCHVSMAGGASKAVERAEARGCECLQIFTTSPRAWKHHVHRDEEVAAFRAGIARLGLAPVTVHASYLLNLATSDSVLHRKSIDLLTETARWSAALGASTVILHPGSCDEARMTAGLRRVANCVTSVLRGLPDGLTLSLEMSAGGRGSVGARFDQLAAVLDHVHGDKRVMVWLDTAHAHGAGHDLRNDDGLEAFVREVSRTVGWERVAGVHANDSKAERGSRRDLHENIGEGTLGSGAFRRLLRHRAFARLPFILETPGFDGKGPDERNMARLRRLRGAE